MLYILYIYIYILYVWYISHTLASENMHQCHFSVALHFHSISVTSCHQLIPYSSLVKIRKLLFVFFLLVINIWFC